MAPSHPGHITGVYSSPATAARGITLPVARVGLEPSPVVPHRDLGQRLQEVHFQLAINPSGRRRCLRRRYGRRLLHQAQAAGLDEALGVHPRPWAATRGQPVHVIEIGPGRVTGRGPTGNDHVEVTSGYGVVQGAQGFDHGGNVDADRRQLLVYQSGGIDLVGPPQRYLDGEALAAVARLGQELLGQRGGGGEAVLGHRALVHISVQPRQQTGGVGGRYCARHRRPRLSCSGPGHRRRHGGSSRCSSALAVSICSQAVLEDSMNGAAG